MEDRPIEQITVIGPGMMGHAIALEFAAGGYAVTLCGRDEERLEQARGKIEKGELGAKTGRGFYEWTPAFTEKWRKHIFKGLVAYAKEDKAQAAEEG